MGCASLCGVVLRYVHPTLESRSAVCIPPPTKALQCASYRGVKLHGGLPTAESSSAVCITPQSQTIHSGVKIEIFVSLWLLLKGQSGKILLRVNTSIMNEKI